MHGFANPARFVRLARWLTPALLLSGLVLDLVDRQDPERERQVESWLTVGNGRTGTPDFTRDKHDAAWSSVTT